MAVKQVRRTPGKGVRFALCSKLNRFSTRALGPWCGLGRVHFARSWPSGSKEPDLCKGGVAKRGRCTTVGTQSPSLKLSVGTQTQKLKLSELDTTKNPVYVRDQQDDGPAKKSGEPKPHKLGGLHDE